MPVRNPAYLPLEGEGPDASGISEFLEPKEETQGDHLPHWAGPARTPMDEAGPTHTLQIGDVGRWLRLEGVLLLVPALGEDLAPGSVYWWEQATAAPITFGTEAPAQLRSLGGLTVSAGQYASGHLVYLGDDEWHLAGDLTEAES